MNARGAAVKFAIFAVVMMIASGFLFMVLGETRTGSTKDYKAVFADASSLRAGNSVRVAGIRVGTVTGLELGDDRKVTVTFNADNAIPVTAGTRAEVRYLNLVGDRYLDLVDAPGPTQVLPAGSTIPLERTAPALDLDLLLGGLKPVVQGLNPQDVNALTSSLLQVFQGQSDGINSLMSHTSSFSGSLADNNEVIKQLIDNLKLLIGTMARDGDKFSTSVDRLERLVSGLSADRDPIGAAIESLDKGTASISDLLSQTRKPLAGTVNQLLRLGNNLDQDKQTLDTALQRAPENYRKEARTGAYGSWIQYYICDLTIRVNDREGRVVVMPWIRSNAGRCQ
ncbi:MCE family protein [Mycolicibacterium llatzerense]|uniref:Mammalian cell entry protein n=1 Tax=Mycolicibacterium llatzerense TaxID=280871 RepID=A0A0D1LFC1_9MYCO|nr:MCE family protein [Mycolicibacterium llatzerense]KIU17167.1 mammalian cell entry protein [Mycolicibacterium llatzerense]